MIWRILICFLAFFPIFAEAKSIELFHRVNLIESLHDVALVSGTDQLTLVSTHNPSGILWSLPIDFSPKSLSFGLYRGERVAIATGNGFLMISLNKGEVRYSQAVRSSPSQYFAADINGDGLSDFLLVSQSQLTVMIQEKSGRFHSIRHVFGLTELNDAPKQKQSDLRLQITSSDGSAAHRRIWLEDLDGDSRQEIMIAERGVVKIYDIKDKQIELTNTHTLLRGSFSSLMNLDGKGEGELISIQLIRPGIDGAILPMLSLNAAPVENLKTSVLPPLQTLFVMGVEIFPKVPDGSRAILLISPRLGPSSRNEIVHLIKDRRIRCKLLLGILKDNNVQWLQSTQLTTEFSEDNLPLQNLLLHSKTWPPKVVWPTSPNQVDVCTINGDCTSFHLPDGVDPVKTLIINDQVIPLGISSMRDSLVILERLP